MVLLTILSCWLLADLFTGFIHWFEDKYMSELSFKYLGSFAEENDLHHRKPTAMILSTGWVNMRSAAAVGWPLAGLLFWMGAPVLIWLTVFFSTFGNLVHRFAHMPKSRVPRWIRGMQEFGLFISHEHHDAHHRSMKKLIPKHLAGYKFCPMTDWVNPVVDFIGFWNWIEFILSIFGLKPTVSYLETKTAE